MPPEHQFYHDVNTKDSNFYLSWANSMSPSLGMFINRLMNKYDHKEQSYNSCNGILQKCKTLPFQVVEKTASKCLAANIVTYSGFMKALSLFSSNSSEEKKSTALPHHQNIRGKEEYK